MNGRHRALRNRAASFRGQPIMLLGVLLFGWAGLRAMLWESPFAIGPEWPAMAASSDVRIAADPAAAPGGVDPLDAPTAGTVGAEAGSLQGESSGWARPPLPAVPLVNPAWGQLPPLAPPSAPIASASAPERGATPTARESGMAVATANTHTLMLVAGLSQLPLPEDLVGLLGAARAAAAPPLLARRGLAQAVTDAVPGAGPAGSVPAGLSPRRSRWSADAWLLLRQDTTGFAQTGLQSYGRSQAGAVLRYRLAPNNARTPQAYLRASTALDDPGNGIRDREVAAGLSVRPLAGLPVRIAAEMRVADLASGTEVRPAAYAVSELPPVALPLGARGEAYLQGGWVGGSFDTAFIDGQARIDKPVARIGPAEFTAGGAVWGGAQRGAERLDAGPSAAATFSLGRVRARMSADYRLRIAGDVEPASGPAVTLYAGF